MTFWPHALLSPYVGGHECVGILLSCLLGLEMGNQLPQGIVTTLEIPSNLNFPLVARFTNLKQERTSCVTICMLLIAGFRTHRERLELQGSAWGVG